ncbi:MAG: M6 family metalloprotease domain-containing protein [candidate division WOR-3 bacterium]
MKFLGGLVLILGVLLAMPPIPGNGRRIAMPGKMERPSRRWTMTDRAGRLLVVLVDFSDEQHRFGQGDFQRLIFGAGTGSMRDYYQEISYGSLVIGGEVAGWVRLSNPYSYYLGDSFGIYGNFPHNSQGLIRDLVQAIDASVDFSRYDWDGDGLVDGLLVVHAGPGAEETGQPDNIWSHKWQLSDGVFGSPGPVQTGDGVSVDEYSIQPERFSDGNLISIGVFCHEFGHLLGLPDLYDTDYSSSGLGMFCLMAAGGWARADGNEPYGSSPTHPCAWCKYLLGWVVPESVEVGSRDSIAPAMLVAMATAPVCYRLLDNPGGVDWSVGNPGSGEYFLVENRQRFGFDRGLPGSGLLITHIDEFQQNNDDESHPLVGILRADRSPKFALDPNDRGSDAQLWKESDTGVRNFTTPSTAFYNGVQSGAVIENISASDSIMTATLKIAPLFLGRVYSFPNPVIVRDNRARATIVYTPTDSVRLAGQFPNFKIRIYNIAGEPVRVLEKPGVEIMPEYRAGCWDLKNQHQRPVSSGMYFYIVEIEEEGIKESNVGRLTVVR